MGVCGVAGVVIVKNYVVRCCSLLGLMVGCIASVASTEGVAPRHEYPRALPPAKGFCPFRAVPYYYVSSSRSVVRARVPRELRRAKIFGPFRD